LILVATILSLATASSSTAEQTQTRLDARFGFAESLTNPGAMTELGAGWTRVLLAWHHIQSSDANTWWGFGRVLREDVLDREVARGIKVAAVVQYTPPWAATDPSHGHRAVPTGLYLPYDDPNNAFGQFVYQTASRYAGRIDEWIIWNEPEFQITDPDVGESYTWRGTEEEFAQLLRVGYLAAKRANPQARVSFPASSYWGDAVMGRPQYYDRILDILDRDPNAAANNYYHDAISLNLYRSADDVYRVHGIFKDIQARHGIDRPIWLTETNAMPSDDRDVPCWQRHTGDPWQTTMQEQAAFAVQAYALAAAAGYEHIAWWRLVDGRPCIQVRLWGAVRDDGSWRPAATALRTAISYFSGFVNAQSVPSPHVNQVAFDRPGAQRVTVLWSTGSEAFTARIAANGATARAVSIDGSEAPLGFADASWLLWLPGATAQFDGAHYIGGAPILLIEEGVDPSAAVVPPIVLR
jgi:hypothetical protein